MKQPSTTPSPISGRHRLRSSLAGALLLIVVPAAGAAAQSVSLAWPSLKAQVSHDRVIPGSNLEKLIMANQDFTMLRADEARDRNPLPPWLRVWWRKAHPKERYSPTDPTGGYPLVLREVHEWMMTHQDLKPGIPGLAERSNGFEKSASETGEERISGAQSAPRSESAISVNRNDTTKVISTSNNISGSGGMGVYFSTNSGSTWGQTLLPLTGSDAFQSDPTIDFTSDGTAWSVAIGINASQTSLQLRSYKSTNNGSSWTFDTTISGSQTNTDKEMIWIDHSATSSFKDNIYAIWHNGTPVYISRRTGGAWQTPIQVSGSETTGTGIGADIRTNSAGDVFGFWPDTGSQRIFVVKSTNGGASFGTPVAIGTTNGSFDIGIPSNNSRRALIYVTAAAYRNGTTNNVFAAWQDLNSACAEPGSSTSSTCKTRIFLTHSTDGGATWSTPAMINNQSSLNDQFFPWMTVDDTNGKAAIVYYDTVNNSSRLAANVFYQSSADGGATWSTPFQTASQATNETSAGADSGNQYGDYIGLTGLNGTFFPSWTDRRNNGSEEIWTAAITDSTGVVTCTPPGAPSGLTATASGTNGANLSWGAVSGATEYHILRATTSGGPYSKVGTATGTTFSDTGLACNTTYYYVVRAGTSASCESVNSNQASATTGACPICTTKTLYSNGFETGSGLSDWTKGTFVSGGSTTDWRGIQTCSAHGGSKIFRFGGSSCSSSYGNNRFNFAQPNGATGIVVAAGSTVTRLSFWHHSSFESGFDGGTLAVSTNGTNYTFVPASAIISGSSYTGTTSTACPPAGAGGVPVFTGTQSSYVNTTVDLDAVCNAISGGSGGCAGQSLRIAFTTITDCSTTSSGWFLDDVTVTACQ